MRLDFIKKVLTQATIVGTYFPENYNVVVDSRSVRPEDIFFCLKGSHEDGHSFVDEALRNGVRVLVIHKERQKEVEQLRSFSKSITLICVEDTLEALVRLAEAWRTRFDIPIIGITGSVGKTSTKQLLKNIILHSGARYLISHGNQNTLIGVSLNILRLAAKDEGAIFEIGISKRDEMSAIVNLLRPTCALITNVGHSHMEGLGSLPDIALEKRAIFSCFTENNIGIVNGDQPLLSNVSYDHPIVRFGTKLTNQIQARKITTRNGTTSFTLKLYNQKYPMSVAQTHVGMVMNMLAASAIAYYLLIPNEAIVKGIQLPFTIKGRFESVPIKRYGARVINDSYNANPESMKAALLSFEQLSAGGKKIAILGDMLELGANGAFWHRQIGRFLRKISSLDHLILVGSLVEWIEAAAPTTVTVTKVDAWQTALETLEKVVTKDSLILVKGSQRMGLANIIESLYG